MYLLRTPVVIPRDVACPCLPEMRIEGTRKLDLERLNARRFIPLENLTKARALAQRCILGPVVRYARSSSALRAHFDLLMMGTAARGSCVCASPSALFSVSLPPSALLSTHVFVPVRLCMHRALRRYVNRQTLTRQRQAKARERKLRRVMSEWRGAVIREQHLRQRALVSWQSYSIAIMTPCFHSL